MPLAIVAAFLSLGLVQEPAFTPDIQAAERALSAALEQHDRVAFERLVAPDATFFTPSLLQGRDAIVQGWIPFLMNTGSTMVLERSRTTGREDVIITEGWLLYSFASGLAAAPRPAAPPAGPAAAGGLMDYRFGMTREQVRQVAACQPYLDVPVTGGLECPNFTFEGTKINVSFMGPALRRIQLWLYEGHSENDAKKATDAALAYLTREAGAVHSYELPAGAEPTTEEIFKALKKMNVPANQAALVQLVTQSGTRPEQFHSRIARLPDDSYGVYVFVSAK